MANRYCSSTSGEPNEGASPSLAWLSSSSSSLGPAPGRDGPSCKRFSSRFLAILGNGWSGAIREAAGAIRCLAITCLPMEMTLRAKVAMKMTTIISVS